MAEALVFGRPAKLLCLAFGSLKSTLDKLLLRLVELLLLIVDCSNESKESELAKELISDIINCIL
jgi:hypothetical protein